jgi:hypothetical protein
MRHHLFKGLLAALSLVAVQQVFANTITIAVVPAVQRIDPGLPLTVYLQISGLGNLTSPSVGTFDLNVAFDPTVLSFNAATFGGPILGDQLDPTGLGNTINFVNPGFGIVELFDVSLDSSSQLNSLQPSSFILGGISFNTVGIGTSPLDLTVNSLGDSDGNPLSVQLQNGSVIVGAMSTVPEPDFLPPIMVVVIMTLLCIGRLRSKRSGRAVNYDRQPVRALTE